MKFACELVDILQFFCQNRGIDQVLGWSVVSSCAATSSLQFFCLNRTMHSPPLSSLGALVLLQMWHDIPNGIGLAGFAVNIATCAICAVGCYLRVRKSDDAPSLAKRATFLFVATTLCASGKLLEFVRGSLGCCSAFVVVLPAFDCTEPTLVRCFRCLPQHDRFVFFRVRRYSVRVDSATNTEVHIADVCCRAIDACRIGQDRQRHIRASSVLCYVALLCFLCFSFGAATSATVTTIELQLCIVPPMLHAVFCVFFCVLHEMWPWKAGAILFPLLCSTIKACLLFIKV